MLPMLHKQSGRGFKTVSTRKPARDPHEQSGFLVARTWCQHGGRRANLVPKCPGSLACLGLRSPSDWPLLRTPRLPVNPPAPPPPPPAVFREKKKEGKTRLKNRTHTHTQTVFSSTPQRTKKRFRMDLFPWLQSSCRRERPRGPRTPSRLKSSKPAPGGGVAPQARHSGDPGEKVEDLWG